MAGLTGALVALPQGVAFATIAGMPPEYGLYAGMIPAIIAALFGSSWHLVSGPTTAASIVLFSVLSPHAEPGTAQYVSLALTLTFLVGLIQLAMGLARMGTLVNFISHSVVTGFTAGAAILIATNQVKHFFGLEIARGTSFSDTWSTLFSQFDQVQPGVMAVATLTLLLGIAVKQLSAEVALHDRGDAGRFGRGRRTERLAGPAAVHGRRAAGKPAAAVGAGAGWRKHPRGGVRRDRGDAAGADRGGVDRPCAGGALRPARGRQPGVHRPGHVEPGRQRSSPAMSPPARSTAAASTTPPAPRRRWRR